MSFIFSEKQPRHNRDWVYVWLCESRRHDEELAVKSGQKKSWPKTNKVLIGRHYINLKQTIYSPEFLDPNRNDINGIPIPKVEQHKAIEETNELKAKFGSNVPPGIRSYTKKIKQPDKQKEKEDESLDNTSTNDGQDDSSQPSFSISDVQQSTRSRYGAFYLYQKIAEKIGLLPILMESFPGDWRKLFNLASYLVTTGNPMYHCERWLDKTEAFPASMSSSTISKLMSSINYNDICKFYEGWIDLRKEKEYLALDISSVSSYSQLLPEVDYGYNREGDKLPQINMCLLLGEQSQLPYFLKTYHGKLKDVGTLKTTLGEIFSLGGRDLTLVMDKGFASEGNISCLTSGPMKNQRFIMALPFTMDLAKQQPKKFVDTIKQPCNIISVSGKTWGTTTNSKLSNGESVFTHVFYNVDKAIIDEYEKQAEIKKYMELATADPDDKNNQRNFKKWLIIKRNNKGQVESIDVNKTQLEKALANSGWLVIISNCVNKAEEALLIYRSKDVVEKAFHRLKGQLDLRRLRIHTDTTMRSKIFVAFLALILFAYINKIMMENDLYKKFTLRELIEVVETLHLIRIKENKLLEPLTSEQKLIFDSFDVPKPDVFYIKDD